ncbi:MAG: VCBS repeat-containing protein, partial [Calothrix sp. SM1_7_51]|nr:VCBS repeat-containing protein [Calothrix sp. SM1_7_51]
NATWFISNDKVNEAGFLPTANNTNWEAEGTTDFNQDGKLDILWRNYITGENVVWLMDGLKQINSLSLTQVPDQKWKIEGLADFNNDGKSDILWRNYNDSSNAIWFINGIKSSGKEIDFTGEFIELEPPPGQTDIPPLSLAWIIAGAGDVNSDNKADIFWRNEDTGENAIWLMDGIKLVQGRFIETLPTRWKIESIGDMNGDGKSDMVWRNNTSDETEIWFLIRLN